MKHRDKKKRTLMYVGIAARRPPVQQENKPLNLKQTCPSRPRVAIT